MKFDIVFTIFSLLSLVMALGHQDDGGETTTGKVLPTLVYVTITTNGKISVVHTKYEQTFMSTFTGDKQSAPLGKIGLGSISGSVGELRSYEEKTVTNAGNSRNYGGALGVICFVLGVF